MLSVKSFIEKTLPQSKACISNVLKRTDNGKATLTVNKMNAHLPALQLDIVDNSNINVTNLNRGRLHLMKQVRVNWQSISLKKLQVLKGDDR